MRVFADNHEFACKIVTGDPKWKLVNRAGIEGRLKTLSDSLFEADDLFETELDFGGNWTALFIVNNAPDSQYDLLIRLIREGKPLPDRILCLADTGREFHGQRDREWVSLAGNIHLVVYFSPDCPVKSYAMGFTILSAVSVMEAIDEIVDLRGKAGVKWVNDIMIDNAKVCGFLAHTLSEGDRISGAILGIGLNVEASPEVAPSAFVPVTGSLRDFSRGSKQANQAFVFEKLINSLAKNYQSLLQGGYSKLLDIYRQRSIILGRPVAVFPDPVSGGENQQERIEGRVTKIGENLELYIEGHTKPVTRGRLIIKD